ncbi:hypothetical protein CNE_BB1p07430 (plasmid) [Cupriavidus necator N-1]|uniref:Uncharacterized protein n=1 Tax=Cupriavidus necator (strain ATCC 43291 / DSM 13513 / CCUG 52238 / LMG 8453 / N-1) TaxID=1042878 RepID=F8GXU0_CUPNN|nr:hypothetical protein CNE_BB1p07430 [Cupriavidus necator N-1]
MLSSETASILMRTFYVQFVESGKDATKAFEAAEQALHFVSALVHLAIIFPWFKAIAFGRNDGNEAQVECELSRLIALICLVH